MTICLHKEDDATWTDITTWGDGPVIVWFCHTCGGVRREEA